VKHTEDMALFPCFDTPLEADFATFEMFLDVGTIEIAFADSNDNKNSIQHIAKKKRKMRTTRK
jgi:hypothetical protein